MKKKQDTKKISLQKLRIAKLNNIQSINGGYPTDHTIDLTTRLTKNPNCTIPIDITVTIAGTTQTRTYRPTQCVNYDD